jgi:hypothetical protein
VGELQLLNGDMKTSLTLLLLIGVSAWAGTTITSSNRHAYGANLGWQDWRGNTNNGAVIGEYVCSGYIYSANAGWIHLGSNAPANGIRYQNNSTNDYGVNHDGLGNLRGYAYGANIGWINFETNGNPRVDLKTGALSGNVYSANCGWISLTNTFAYVKTDAIQPGTDSDGDGITDAWELSYTNTLAAFSASSDGDGDGMNDLAEHRADTSPLDVNDVLRITAYSALFGGSDETNTLTWTSKETRCYQLGYRTNLQSEFSWVPIAAVISPDPGSETTRLLSLTPALPERYLRVEALKPLSP